jgi:hypothetical protein
MKMILIFFCTTGMNGKPCGTPLKITEIRDNLSGFSIKNMRRHSFLNMLDLTESEHWTIPGM